MILGVNFSLEELERSSTAARLKIDNRIPDELLANAAWMVAAVLQPIRTMIGKPMFVLGGFRCVELNARVGGAPNSDHLKALGVDFRFDGVSDDAVAKSMFGLPIRIAIYYPDQDRWHVSAAVRRKGETDTIRRMGPDGALPPFFRSLDDDELV